MPAVDDAGVHAALELIAHGCRFFEDYKKNEHKEVKIDDFLNAEDAKKAVKQSMVSIICCVQCHKPLQGNKISEFDTLICAGCLHRPVCP